MKLRIKKFICRFQNQEIAKKTEKSIILSREVAYVMYSMAILLVLFVPKFRQFLVRIIILKD